MKYKFLYDNLQKNDVVEFYDGESVGFRSVNSVHCNCNSTSWKEHCHIDGYICEYEDTYRSHSSRIRSIWRYENSKTLKRVAKKHPRTKVWEVNENTLSCKEDAGVKRLREAVILIEKHIKEVLEDE